MIKGSKEPFSLYPTYYISKHQQCQELFLRGYTPMYLSVISSASPTPVPNPWKLVSMEITSSIEWLGISRCAVGNAISNRGLVESVPPTCKVIANLLITVLTSETRSANKSRLRLVAASELAK